MSIPGCDVCIFLFLNYRYFHFFNVGYFMLALLVVTNIFKVIYFTRQCLQLIDTNSGLQSCLLFVVVHGSFAFNLVWSIHLALLSPTNFNVMSYLHGV